MKLEDLHAINPYKGARLLEYDPFGWGSHDPNFEKLIRAVRPSLVLEVGSWKGASAIHVAKASRDLGLDTKIVCIDTWLGSLEFWLDQTDDTRYKALNLNNGYPSVFYTFLSNVLHEGLEDRIIPFPQTSLIAADWFKINGVQADMIYIDASHTFREVMADLEAYWPIVKPGGVLFGDDWETWGEVKEAVDEFCGHHLADGIFAEYQARQWEIWKPL